MFGTNVYSWVHKYIDLLVQVYIVWFSNIYCLVQIQNVWYQNIDCFVKVQIVGYTKIDCLVQTQIIGTHIKIVWYKYRLCGKQI